VFHFFTIFEIQNAWGAVRWGFGKNYNHQISVDYDVILRVHPSSKVSKLNSCLYRRKRSLKIDKSGAKRFADPGFVSTFNILFCVNSITNRVGLTNNDFCAMTSS